jgi:predicted RNase H-like HicB family nuclease
MEGLSIAKCYISPDIPPLHILFTKEDGVVVSRCLDFSISSHGEDIEEAKEAIGEAIVEYLEHAIENDAFDELFDPDLEIYWKLYRELELKLEAEEFKKNLEKIKEVIQKKELVYT